ncbi:MAG: pitrilysin family protein [Thermodesulfobacteriota bacterium]
MSRICKSILRNGINVITEEMTDIGSVTIGVWVKIGSRHEDASECGISHFIEHLLFKGTKRRSAINIVKEIESVGGILNAFTGREYTCFYVKVLSKDISLAIDLLSDILINSRFADKEIEKERCVILQEIKMVEDTPDDLVHDIFFKAILKGHPMGRPILGEIQNINSIKRKDIISYFKRFYNSDRIIITAAGNLKHKEITRILNTSFGRVERRSIDKPVSTPVFHPCVMLKKRNLEQVHLCLGVPTLPQSHPDRYKLYLLNTMLGGGMSSRLFQEIREKRGLAYSVYSYLNLHQDIGSLVVYAGTSSDDFADVVKLIIKEFVELSKGLERKELTMAKEQLIGNMMIGLESSDNRMTKLAKDEIYFKKVVPLDEIISNIKRVTTPSLRSVARKLLNPDASTLVAIGRVNKGGLPGVFRGKILYGLGKDIQKQ